MRRALRRAGQVFMAAGALGLAGPALAQTAHPTGNSTFAAVRTSSVGALDETQVELAWLADKGTFHLALGAHVSDGSLVVSGFVPNAGVRAEALRVARQHTSLQVVDHLHINGNANIPANGGAPDELTQQAKDLLADAFGALAAGLDITAREDGTLTVRGTLPSLHDKLVVSRTMRQLPGCGGVVNMVSVVGSQRAPAVMGKSAPAVVAKATPAGWSDRPVAAKGTKFPAKSDAVKRPSASEDKMVQTAYTTTGTMSFDDDLPAKPAPAAKADPFAPLPEAAAPKLKEAVEAACGKHAQNVEVTVQDDKLLHVVVKVADVKTQLDVTDRILIQVPEMALPNVRLDMQVAEEK